MEAFTFMKRLSRAKFKALATMRTAAADVDIEAHQYDAASDIIAFTMQKRRLARSLLR